MAEDIKLPTEDKRFAPQKPEPVEQPITPATNSPDLIPKSKEDK